MRTPAVLLGFMIGAVAFKGYGLLAFVLLVGYVVLDAAWFWRVGE